MTPIPMPCDEETNARVLEELVAPIVAQARGRPVVLVDGDGTLSPSDSSRVFLSRAGGDPAIIKARFQALGYCFDAFRYHTQMHLAVPRAVFDRLCDEVGAETSLYPGAADFLRRAAELAVVVVVSAGVPGIWKRTLDRAGLSAVQVLGGIDPDRPLVLGRGEKGRLAASFARAHNRIIAIGDSDVDTEMLRAASESIVVVNHRQNKDLVPHFPSFASIWQVVPQGTPHAGIRIRTFEDLHHLIRAAAQ